MPHLCRKALVSVEVISGPPSDASSSGNSYVTNVRRKWLVRPVAPPVDCQKIGQFEYVHRHEVVYAPGYEEVQAHCLGLIGVDDRDQCDGRYSRLQWCHPVTVFAIFPCDTDVGRCLVRTLMILHERSSSIRPGGPHVWCSVPHY